MYRGFVLLWLFGISLNLANALSLGQAELKSALNEKLHIEIPLFDLNGLSANDIYVVMENEDFFKKEGLRYLYIYSEFKFTIEIYTKERGKIIITSDSLMNEPFLTLVVRAAWPSGSASRQYSLLVDPKDYVIGKTGLTSVKVLPVQEEKETDQAFSSENIDEAFDTVPEDGMSFENGEFDGGFGEFEGDTSEDLSNEDLFLWDNRDSSPKNDIKGTFLKAEAGKEKSQWSQGGKAVSRSLSETSERHKAADIQRKASLSDSKNEGEFDWDEIDALLNDEYNKLIAANSLPTKKEKKVLNKPVKTSNRKYIKEQKKYKPDFTAKKIVQPKAFEYTVKKGDQLWGIVASQELNGQSVQQVMVAIKKLNPHAFIRDNINLLRAGVKLKFPQLESASQFSLAQAISEVRTDNAAWQSYRYGGYGEEIPEVTKKEKTAQLKRSREKSKQQRGSEAELRVVAANNDDFSDIVLENTLKTGRDKLESEQLGVQKGNIASEVAYLDSPDDNTASISDGNTSSRQLASSSDNIDGVKDNAIVPTDEYLKQKAISIDSVAIGSNANSEDVINIEQVREHLKALDIDEEKSLEIADSAFATLQHRKELSEIALNESEEIESAAVVPPGKVAASGSSGTSPSSPQPTGGNAPNQNNDISNSTALISSLGATYIPNILVTQQGLPSPVAILFATLMLIALLMGVRYASMKRQEKAVFNFDEDGNEELKNVEEATEVMKVANTSQVVRPIKQERSLAEEVQACINQNDNDKAIELLKKGLNVEPKNANYLVQLMGLYVAKDELHLMKKVYDRLQVVSTDEDILDKARAIHNAAISQDELEDEIDDNSLGLDDEFEAVVGFTEEEEMVTKLKLAQSYIDVGDNEAARAILGEISDTQIKKDHTPTLNHLQKQLVEAS